MIKFDFDASKYEEKENEKHFAEFENDENYGNKYFELDGVIF